jgi:hypothetical protein
MFGGECMVEVGVWFYCAEFDPVDEVSGIECKVTGLD